MKWIGFVLWGILLANVLVGQNEDELLNERVSFAYKKMPLREVLSDIDNTYPLDFNYFDSEALNQSINIDIQGETLENALIQLFESTNMQYMIKGNHVMLKKKLETLSLQGQIRDKLTGEPLSLAAVSIKGKPIGIVSKPNGEFGLMLPQNYENDTLFVSMLGYRDYELVLNDGATRQPLNISLETEDQILQEIMIYSDMGKWQGIEPQSTVKTAGKKLPMGLFTTLASFAIPSEGLRLVDVRCGTGKLFVTASEDNQIRVDAEILTRSLSEKETRKFIDKYLDLSYKIEGDTIYIRSFFKLEKEQKKNNSFPLGAVLGTPASKINLTIALPPSLFFKLRDGSGGVLIKDVKNDMLVLDGSGNMQIRNVQGNIRVHDGSGYLSIEDVKGRVYVKDRSGKLELSKITGNLTVYDASGGMSLREIGQQAGENIKISIRDKSGGITATKINGNVTVKDNSGGISLSNVEGKIKISDRSGGVHLYQVGDSVKIKDRSGKVYKH